MEDTSLFMQWAMNTLHPAPAVDDVCGQGQATFPSPAVDDVCGQGQATFPSLQPLPEASYAAERVQELLITGANAAANSWSSRNTTHGSGGHVLAPETMDHHDVLPPSANYSAGRAAHAAPTGGNSLTVSWNFSAVSAEPVAGGTLETSTTTTRGLPEPAYGSQMTPPMMRKAGLIKSTGSTSMPYAHEHIIAERKRREKINQRFVELSAVIPGLKKMDKATILSDATRYMKELQGTLNSREAAGGGVVRCSGTAILVKRPSCCATATHDKEGSPLAAPAAVRRPLPEIEAQLSGNNVMVRVLCDNGKGVVPRVLGEVEGLHLTVVHASVIPSPACALNITITAKVEAAFIVTTEEIICRVSSALSQQQI